MKKKFDEINILVGSLGGGGAEKVAINLANNFNKKVTLLSLTSFKDYELKSLNKNVNLIIYDNFRIRSSILKYLFYLRKNKPKIILSISRETNLVLGLIKVFLDYNPKLIFREASTKEFMKTEIPNSQLLSKLLHKYFPLIIRLLISFYYSKCSKIIVSSKDVADDIRSFLLFKKPKIKVIPPPVLPEEFNKNNILNCEDPWIKDKSLKVILGVGRLCKQKRFDILIKAFSIVHKKHKNTRLIICGQGQDKEKLLMLANSLNISEFVSLKGFLPDPYPYFKGADIFCLSSEYEAFGLVLIEAMAFGTKIVTSNCRGGPNSVFNKNKYIDFAPVNNYRMLSTSIIRSLYFPSPAPYLIKESKNYSSQKNSLNYLKEIYS